MVDRREPYTRSFRGACLCQAVTYEVEDAFAFAFAANCHCSACGRTTGSAFKAFAGIAREKLQVIAREDAVLIFGDPDGGHDVHCVRCGSFLYPGLQDGERGHVPLGTLMDDPTIRPSAHIFVGSKAPWFTITDGLPQYHEFAQG